MDKRLVDSAHLLRIIAPKSDGSMGLTLFKYGKVTGLNGPAGYFETILSESAYQVKARNTYIDQ